MATSSELSELTARRRAAAAARAAQKAQPVAEQNPDPIDVSGGPIDTSDSPSARTIRTEAGKSETQIAKFRTDIDLSRQITKSDLVMPKLKISQAMSKVNTEFASSGGSSGVAQGNWYVSTSGRNLGKVVYIVPVDFYKSRSMFASGKGVICRSFDMLHGEGDPGILCEGTQEEIDDLPADDRGCPLRLWDRDKEAGTNTPPPCGINFNYPILLLDPDNLSEGRSIAAVLTLRSTAAKVAKTLNTIATEGMMSDPIWYEAIIKLSLETKSNAKGTFFVPTVAYEGETSGATLAKATDFAKSINAQAMRRSLEQDDTE